MPLDEVDPSEDSTPDDPWWVESLTRAFNYDDDREDGPLTLIELADELELWAQDGRPGAWPRNQRLIKNEVAATAAEASTWADEATAALISAVVTVVHGHAELDETARVAILDVVGRVRSHLLSEPAITGQAQRIIDMAQNEAVPYNRVVQSRELLDDQLRGLGRDPHSALSNAASAIRGERFGEAVASTLEERIEDGLRSLVDVAEPADVVVWLIYDHAEVGKEVVSAGPLTLFSVRWALANVRAKTSTEFPMRAELEKFSERPGLWLDDPEALHHKVIARVDLGRRQTYGAYEDAASIVSAFVDTAVDSVSGRGWTPYGMAHLQVDDDFGGFHRFSAFDFEGQDEARIRETGWEVTRSVERLGPRLAADKLPRLLLDATGLAAARRALEDDDRVPIAGLRIGAQRSATLLDDHTVEAVAGWATMETTELEKALRVEWIHSRWQAEIANVLNTAIWMARRAESAEAWQLERDLMEYDGDRDGKVMFLGRALTHERRILDLLTDPHDLRRGELVIAALRDVDAYNTVFEEGAALEALALSRYTRVRNGLTHGNPVSNASVIRNRSFSRFMARGAVDLALRAFAEGADLPAYIERASTERAALLNRFLEGTPWSELWVEDSQI